MYILSISYRTLEGKKRKNLNKEYRLDTVSDEMKISYGSVDKDLPKVIYVNGKMWLSPKHKVNGSKIIPDMYKQLKYFTINFYTSNSNFGSKCIIDLDITSETIRPGQKKFFQFDIFLRQKENIQSLIELQQFMKGRSKLFSSELSKYLNDIGFTISKKKKT